MFGYGFYFDPTYLILLPAIIITMWAQAKVSSTYAKYSKYRTTNGYSGSQIARNMLDEAGLYDVKVVQCSGHLTDHYNPKTRVVNLSSEVYNGTTISSAGIAAHEVGHAIQHKEKYAPLVLRTSIARVVGFGSQLSIILFMIGVLVANKYLIDIGILFFSGTVIYQLVTLPVEFNASMRAINVLDNRSILLGEEVRGAKKVLGAAALTYVAATLMAILQLVRLLAISNRYDD